MFERKDCRNGEEERDLEEIVKIRYMQYDYVISFILTFLDHPDYPLVDTPSDSTGREAEEADDFRY